MQLNLLQFVAGADTGPGTPPAPLPDQNGFTGLLALLGAPFTETQGKTEIPPDTQTSTNSKNSFPETSAKVGTKKNVPPEKRLTNTFPSSALPLVPLFSIPVQAQTLHTFLPNKEVGDDQVQHAPEATSGSSQVKLEGGGQGGVLPICSQGPFSLSNEMGSWPLEMASLLPGSAPSPSPGSTSIQAERPDINSLATSSTASKNAPNAPEVSQTTGAPQAQNLPIEPTTLTQKPAVDNLATVKTLLKNSAQEPSKKLKTIDKLKLPHTKTPETGGKQIDVRLSGDKNSTEHPSQVLKDGQPDPQMPFEKNSSSGSESESQHSADPNHSEHIAMATSRSRSGNFADAFTNKDDVNLKFAVSTIHLDSHSQSVSPSLPTSFVAATDTTNVQTNSTSPAKASQTDTPSPIPQPQDAPIPKNINHSHIQVARIVDHVGQAEMHIGMRTPAFGSVEVHTVVHQSEVGVAVGSEHGDLKTFLSAEIPGLQANFNQQDLQFSNIDFHNLGQGTYQFHGGSDSQPNHHQSLQQQSVPTPSFFKKSDMPEEEVLLPQLYSTGLNIRA